MNVGDNARLIGCTRRTSTAWSEKLAWMRPIWSSAMELHSEQSVMNAGRWAAERTQVKRVDGHQRHMWKLLPVTSWLPKKLVEKRAHQNLDNLATDQCWLGPRLAVIPPFHFNMWDMLDMLACASGLTCRTISNGRVKGFHVAAAVDSLVLTLSFLANPFLLNFIKSPRLISRKQICLSSWEPRCRQDLARAFSTKCRAHYITRIAMYTYYMRILYSCF